MTGTRIVVVESPYAASDGGSVARNEVYGSAALRDALSRNETPFASHLLYTRAGVLDDRDPAERLRGIEAGFHVAGTLLAGAKALARATEWSGEDGRGIATEVVFCWVFYVDFGFSPGMLRGLARARLLGAPCRTRTIGPPFSDLARSDARLEAA